MIRIYPIGSNGEERVWRRSYESCQELIRNGKLLCTNGGTIYQIIESEERKSALFTNWTGTRYNAGTKGANLLADIIGKKNPFSYPKSIHTVEDAIFSTKLNRGSVVLDCFAGSGTTGHAAIRLNRDDNGQRRYVLVEIGDHFDDVLVPRIKKVIYSSEWNDGKPSSTDGISQIFKYVRLESYEDTLDALERTPPESSLLNEDKELLEDYQLRYALGVETSASASLLGGRFDDPFLYETSVVRDGVRQRVQVDLPETFNFLIGMKVESRRILQDVLVIFGVDFRGRRCLTIWRNAMNTNNENLEEWFRENRPRLPEFIDVVYVNGDHTLNVMGEAWSADAIEPEFRELMFEGQ